IHGCRRSGVAGVVDAVAAVGDGLMGAFCAKNGTGDGIGCDAGLDRASIRAVEVDGDVGVVPVTRVRLWVAAAADYRSCFVNVETIHGRRRGNVAGVVDAVPTIGERLPGAFGADGTTSNCIGRDT